MGALRVGAIAAALFFGAAASAHAAALESITPPDESSYFRPVFVTSDPADADRLFVVEQEGEIELSSPNARHTFLDIKDRVRYGGEQGLLSMAPAPDFAQSGLFYVFYVRDDHDIVVSEFEADGDLADPSSERLVLVIDHPFSGEGEGQHYGGQLQFGPDGYLYISVGDGSGGSDAFANAQNGQSLLGKLLRIDPRPSGSGAYSVPPLNPFVGDDGVRDEIWSIGFRNPWRFSFDRYTGDLSVADVGERGWEEINYRTVAQGAGRAENFGWSCREGAAPFATGQCPDPDAEFVDPVFAYPHPPAPGQFAGCSVTGGYVVRDPGLSGLFGRYLFTDFCARRLVSVDPLSPESQPREEGGTMPADPEGNVAFPGSFGEDACGRLYVTTLNHVEDVYRITDGDNSACTMRTVAVAVSGNGRVTGPGIDCPGDCETQVYDARMVELSAIPDHGDSFVAWGGACAGAGGCETRVIGGDAEVTASFTGGSTAPKAQTALTLAANKRSVRRGKRVRLKVSAAPCAGRQGDEVTLVRNGRARQAKRLGAACTAGFRLQVKRTATYSATVAEDELNLAASSNPVKVRAKRKRR